MYETPAALGQQGPWSPDEGQTDLATVGVAGEHEIHDATLYDLESVVRLMGQQDHGLHRPRLTRQGIV
jgi:hypothetical protein